MLYNHWCKVSEEERDLIIKFVEKNKSETLLDNDIYGIDMCIGVWSSANGKRIYVGFSSIEAAKRELDLGYGDKLSAKEVSFDEIMKILKSFVKPKEPEKTEVSDLDLLAKDLYNLFKGYNINCQVEAVKKLYPNQTTERITLEIGNQELTFNRTDITPF